MRVWTVAKIEFLRLWHNRITRVAMLAGIIIPLLYAGLYLWAFWDPYGNVDKIPVAVVNLDQGGTQDDKHVNYGQDFIDNLKDDTTMEWHFVDAKTAKDGLEGNQYFLMITIPKDFTQKALSVTGNHPEQASLIFTSNQGKNYLVSSISKRVETELVKDLGNKISEKYISRLLDVVGKAKDGITEASDAARKLADGASRLQSGSSRLASNVAQLSQGLSQTSSGSDQIASGLTRVSQGLSALHDQIGPLAGPGSQLATGMQNASDASRKLLQASNQAADGIKQTTSGLNTMQSNLQQIQQGIGQTDQLVQASLANIQAMQQTNPNLQSDPQMQQLLRNLQMMQQSVPNLGKGLNQLGAGMGTMSSSLQSIESGQRQISSGLGQLSDQLQKGSQGVTQFTNGVGQIQGALTQLNQGVTRAQQNESKIAAAEHQMQQGADQLFQGSIQLRDGASQLADGNSELAGKLADANNQGSVPSASSTANVMANPVKLSDQPIHPVANYGTGLAPYFFSLSYWVGAFMLYFLISLQDPRWYLLPVSKGAVILGKYLTLAPIAVLQAVVSSFVIESSLHLKPENTLGYYGFNILLALSFTAMVGMFIALLGTGPGRFVTILVLILQLTSAAGTFPIEMVPGFFQALHPFLPMTYSVNALREILSIGDWNAAWKDAGVIAGYGIASLLIAILFARGRVKIGDLQAKDTLVP
jgi:putative membrane protein